MRESKLTQEPKPGEKKRVHPAAIAGPAVAVGAALAAVFISTSGGNDKPPEPAAALEAPATTGSEPLASVQSAPQAPQPPTPGAAGVGAANALAFANTDLEFNAALPPEAGNGPIIAKLRKEAEDMLARVKTEAREGQADARANGAPGIPWDYQISWDVLGRSGDFVSLVGTLYRFTGGAHGLGATDTRIASIKTGDELTFSDMMRFGKVPSPAVVIATCEALKKEKLARIDAATVFDEPVICAGPNANVRLQDAKIGLAPSTVAGKFGGIYVYFDPYAVGAYAEGSYAVAVSHEVFSEDLKAPYKELFAGDPLPLDQN